jgi:hypothetical protein
VSKQRIEEETLRQQFETVLSLRMASRSAQADAKAQSERCESEWVKLKQMLRAGS